MPISSLIGQDELKIRLHGMLTGSAPQSFLITGRHGMGRSLFAHELAGALLCLDPKDGERCCACDACRLFENGSNPDLIEVLPSPDEGISVKELREQVIAEQDIKATYSSRKVFVIDADELSEAGQNLLLKSIEEPPKQVSFILCVSSGSHLLPTVMSRVTELKMRDYTSSEVLTILKTRFGQTVEEEKLRQAAEFSSGNPGKAVAIIEDDTFEETRGQMLSLLTDMPDMSYTELLYGRYKYFSSNSHRIDDLLTHMLRILNDMAIAVSEGKELKSSMLSNSDLDMQITEFVSSHPYMTQMRLGKAAGYIGEFKEKSELNTHFDTTLSTMLIKMIKEFKE